MITCRHVNAKRKQRDGMAKRNLSSYPEIQAIRDRLNGKKPSEVIILFIPSHDRHEKELNDRDIWAQNALALFGKLFHGATAFEHLQGVYQPDKDSKPLYDNPIMVQSLTPTECIADEDNQFELAEFCRNMGRRTNQASIGLVVNNFFIDITISHG